MAGGKHLLTLIFIKKKEDIFQKDTYIMEREKRRKVRIQREREALRTAETRSG